MTVRANKPAFSIREKLKELQKPIGLKGSELMRAETAQEARDLVSAGRKNLIINGDMQVSQRGTTFTTPTSGAYTIDRFQAYQASPASAYSVTRETDAPPGFTYSLKITSDTSATIVAGTYHYFGQRIEGFNWAQLAYGTSSAKPITLSFWVKSSIPGTHSGVIKNSDQNRSIVWEYNIKNANTWEYKSITIPGCPDGTWLTDSGTGGWVYFSAAVGSTYQTSTPGVWQSINLVGSTNGVDLTAVSGATWYMTGLQVEVGKNATEFEHRSYGEELALCQRYFEVVFSNTGYTSTCLIGKVNANNQAIFAFPWKVEKRASPTTAITGTGILYYNGTTSTSSYSYGNLDNGTTGGRFTLNSVSENPLTVGQAVHLDVNSTPPFIMTVSAEL